MLEIIFILLLIIFYSLVYLKIFSKENIIFFKFFIYFIVYTIIVYFLLIRIEAWYGLVNDLKILIITSYLVNFFALILIINLKSLYSPSDFIYQTLNRSKYCSRKEIIDNLKKENIIEKRIIDLKKQKLIKENKEDGNLELTKFGFIFSLFFYWIKEFYNLRSEG